MGIGYYLGQLEIRIIRNYFLIIVLFSFFLATPALALDIFLFPAQPELSNDSLVVSFGLDTGADKINAVSGELSYDVSKLELVTTSNANSFISLWLEAPNTKTAGSVSFSGIAPGGFAGQGKIISLIFKSKTGEHEALNFVHIKNVEILKNDGTGSPIATKIISPSASLISSLDVSSASDNSAPELFKPILSKNDPLLGNQSYLIFSTTDKGSGVDKYFVAETKSRLNIHNAESLSAAMWQEAESPYLLQDQSLSSYVYVKAVDRAGNALVVELDQGKNIYQFWWFWVIIIVALIGVCLWLKRKFF